MLSLLLLLLLIIRFYLVPVLLTQPTKDLNLVRKQIYLFVELIPHKTFPEDQLSFVRNVPDGSTVTRTGGLALLYVARGRFFDSQSKVESSNTKKKFKSGLEYSLHSFPPPHTGHLPDCLHLIHTIPRQVCKTT